jgi:plasmid stabilization system protein ParE
MPECKVQITAAAWRDIDRISDYHLMKVGPKSAERITDKLLDTMALLGTNPYMGAQHPDPVLAKNEYRKVLCGDYVCVYKVLGSTVYVYRIVNGRMDYPKLFK